MSVVTPSIAKTRAPSLNNSSKIESKSFHVSNPNPQPWTNETPKYLGPRDLGYKTWEKLYDPTDVIRFGKRVNYEHKLTSQGVMEEHLKQIQEKMQLNKQQHEFKRRQELEYLNQVKELDALEKARVHAGRKALNEDFMYYNENLKNESQ